jgi:hypothetical protein
VSMLCRFPYSVCRPPCRGEETGQAREVKMKLWLLASRRRADVVACVPTIESSLTPAGAVAVDRARTTLDHLCLPSCCSLAALCGEDRPSLAVSRALSTVRSPARAQAEPRHHPSSVPPPCAHRARCCLGPCPGSARACLQLGRSRPPFLALFLSASSSTHPCSRTGAPTTFLVTAALVLSLPASRIPDRQA